MVCVCGENLIYKEAAADEIFAAFTTFVFGVRCVSYGYMGCFLNLKVAAERKKMQGEFLCLI